MTRLAKPKPKPQNQCRACFQAGLPMSLSKKACPDCQPS